ncbi:MAG: ABC transporter ATP-binding protein [Elainellaceae cyanobacterium]
MAKVYLEHITRSFGTTIAVDDITFGVPDGEFWVLVGPSGCGKSTILRTIAGLDRATSGNLYIGDRLVNTIPARQRDVSMVFQNYALYPHMTVAQNLAFGLRMRQADRKTIDDRITLVAKSLNIDQLLHRKPGQLSGGQQQRVALGRAIARQPQVFLLDEPLSNLDAQLREETRAELKQLHQTVGITTIYVTHDQIEAMTLADQIVVIDQGRIQQIGPPQEVYAHPANQMVATFLGSPPMNLLSGVYRDTMFYKMLVLEGQSIPCPDRFWECLKPYTDRPIHVGIRPEHLQLAAQGRTGQLMVDVILVEPLGKEILIRAKVPGEMNQNPSLMNVQLPPDTSVRVGDRLHLVIDLDRAFVFDPQTGDRLI